MATDLDRKLNDFAIRSFRDVADQDYIAARLAYRAGLLPQFLWAAQQAVEKYLKAILFFYRVPARSLRHDIPAALRLLKKLPFEIEFSKTASRTIAHVGALGPYRYLEAPWSVVGYALPELDLTVWEVRRYCQTIDHEMLALDGTDPRVTQSIADSESNPRSRFAVQGGLLEIVLSNKNHPARGALIWQNACYGSKVRQRVRATYSMNFANPPLMLHPEILEDVKKLAFVPGPVQHACKHLWLPEKIKQQKAAKRNKSRK